MIDAAELKRLVDRHAMYGVEASERDLSDFLFSHAREILALVEAKPTLSNERKREMNSEPFDGNNHFTPEQIAQDDILRFFKYGHLPAHLQAHSKPWADLARHVIESVPRSAERTVALRKLLEGKDAAVRAALPK